MNTEENSQNGTSAPSTSDQPQTAYSPEQQILLDKFAALTSKEGSQNKACLKIGIAAAIMTQLRAGKYNGDIDGQFAKLAAYFGTKEASEALPSSSGNVEYKPISTSADIYERIRACQLMGGLAVLGGKAGIGKTMAAKKYEADHPSNAILITLNPCFSTLRSVLRILCKRLNVQSRTIEDMWNGIAAKLRDGGVIIIDESQNCLYRVIEALRALSDQFAEDGQTLGIVFIGNLESTENFSTSKNAEFDQIASRTKFRKKYTTDYITKADIQMLFPELAACPPEIDFLHKIAQSSNAIRGARNLFDNAKNNGNITYPGLVAMAKHMQLKV